MTRRPDPVAIRAAARQMLRAADDLEHDASVACGSSARLDGRWAGSAALVHMGAVDDYARGLRATATGLREVARVAIATAQHLDRELTDLARLEARRASLDGTVTVGVASCLEARIEDMWSRIRCHQARFAHALDGVDPQRAPQSSGRRMRTGPVRVPDLGVVDPGRMRTGPVRPIGAGPRNDLWDPGHMRTGPVRRLLVVRRPVVTP
ncbi:WXG100 family type VII secretion target [Allobranchiibius sp. CTAmp26]|uniref:WXG100 family type VII secretion target n=1 Tax=Allobranchiibius sp. CTAmp26 TaxID=2815214 RepID=UPI001AA0EA10|nr:hypothetical protein [Allobranchiibius sp. CTAmp26]MBO1756085.1 hypothetical protein [Allobranchiibius sp. CTAmp26]